MCICAQEKGKVSSIGKVGERFWGFLDAFTVPVGATVGKELFHSLGSYRRKTSSCKNFRVQKLLDSRRLCAKAP